MADDRLDLSPLDPTADRDRFNRIVGSIMGRVEGALEERRVRGGAVVQVVAWRTPLLAAAAVLFLLCGGVLLRVSIPVVTSQGDSLAEAIGVPTILVRGIENSQLPSAADVLFGFE